MATTICDGAARKSALTTRKRLTSYHRTSPPTTDSVPARYRRRSVATSRRQTPPAACREPGALTALNPSLVALISLDTRQQA